MDSARGALLITVFLLLLFIFCLEMPGNLKWLSVLALALNIRWWWFMAKAAPPEVPRRR